jgi:hypothetical protein
MSSRLDTAAVVAPIGFHPDIRVNAAKCRDVLTPSKPPGRQPAEAARSTCSVASASSKVASSSPRKVYANPPICSVRPLAPQTVERYASHVTYIRGR